MQYGNQYYAIGGWDVIPPIVKRLIFVNAAVFTIGWLLETFQGVSLSPYFGLRPAMVADSFTIWQFGTYMFLHGGFWHLFFNMFVLWMFGSEIERQWGGREFLFYYLVTGIGAGIFYFIFNLNSSIPTIGASGAVYGILTAFGLLYPNRVIYLYLLFPIPAKYFVLILGAVAFLSSVSSAPSGIAHLAHLGGMVIGFLLIRFHIGLDTITSHLDNRREQRRMRIVYKKEREEKNLRGQVDQILDKMHRVGYEGLTSEEKNALQRASRMLSREDE